MKKNLCVSCLKQSKTKTERNMQQQWKNKKSRSIQVQSKWMSVWERLNCGQTNVQQQTWSKQFKHFAETTTTTSTSEKKKEKKMRSDSLIGDGVFLPTKIPKHNGFDYLSNALSAPFHPEQRKRAPNLMIFCFGSVLFLIARPISHNWKGRNGFCLPMHRHTQGYQRAIHEPDGLLTNGKKKKIPKRKHLIPWRNEEEWKNQCTILGDGILTNETKRLILTVNIDTSEYLNMYATLEVQRPKWIHGYWGKTDIEHQIHMFCLKMCTQNTKKNTHHPIQSLFK